MNDVKVASIKKIVKPLSEAKAILFVIIMLHTNYF